jgi:hypothetical protein
MRCCRWASGSARATSGSRGPLRHPQGGLQDILLRLKDAIRDDRPGQGPPAEQLQAALAHRRLIEQAKGSSWVGRSWTLRLPLSACVGQPTLNSPAGRCGPGRDPWPALPVSGRDRARHEPRAGQGPRDRHPTAGQDLARLRRQGEPTLPATARGLSDVVATLRQRPGRSASSKDVPAVPDPPAMAPTGVNARAAGEFSLDWPTPAARARALARPRASGSRPPRTGPLL